MVTPIEIADTAIKIGLGAIISGCAAYLIARLNHRRDLEKTISQRRAQLLEVFAQEIEIFTHAVLKQWAFITNWIAFEPEGKPLDEHSESEFSSIRSEIVSATNQLISAESKLLLLGENKCQELLRDYGESVKIYRDEALVQRLTLTKEGLASHRKELLNKRKALFYALSKAYRRVR